MKKYANFYNIYRFYDLINSFLTLGFDKSWRNKATKLLKPGNVLDLGSGTGAAYKQLKGLNVTALDPDEKMLSRNKFERKIIGVSEQLPFEDNIFDNIFCAFVLRNVEDIDKTFNEIRRVLKKDGVFVLLDLTRPKNSFLSLVHKIGTFLIIHIVGLLTLNFKEYRFLYTSLDKLDPPEELILNTGLETISLERMGFLGFVYLAKFKKS